MIVKAGIIEALIELNMPRKINLFVALAPPIPYCLTVVSFNIFSQYFSFFSLAYCY
jgi:hypothetical protein